MYYYRDSKTRHAGLGHYSYTNVIRNTCIVAVFDWVLRLGIFIIMVLVHIEWGLWHSTICVNCVYTLMWTAVHVVSLPPTS